MTPSLPPTLKELYFFLSVFQFETPYLHPECLNQGPLQQERLVLVSTLVLWAVTSCLMITNWCLHKRGRTEEDYTTSELPEVAGENAEFTHSNPMKAPSHSDSEDRSPSTDSSKASSGKGCHPRLQVLLGWALRLLFILLTLMYPLLMATAVRMITCSTVNVSDVEYRPSEDESSSWSVLTTNTAIVCYGDDHIGVGILSWMALFLYGVGYPVATFLFILRAVKASELSLSFKHFLLFRKQLGFCFCPGVTCCCCCKRVKKVRIDARYAANVRSRSRTQSNVSVSSVEEHKGGPAAEISRSATPVEYSPTASIQLSHSNPVSQTSTDTSQAAAPSKKQLELNFRSEWLFEETVESLQAPEFAAWTQSDYRATSFWMRHLDLCMLFFLSAAAPLLQYSLSPTLAGASVYATVLLLLSLVLALSVWMVQPYWHEGLWKMYVRVTALLVAGFGGIPQVFDVAATAAENTLQSNATALREVTDVLAYIMVILCGILFLVLLAAFWVDLFVGASREQEMITRRASLAKKQAEAAAMHSGQDGPHSDGEYKSQPQAEWGSGKWVRLYDESSGHYYWLCESSGESAWEHDIIGAGSSSSWLAQVAPWRVELVIKQAVEAGLTPLSLQQWTRAEDDAGNVYWCHATTGESAWDQGLGASLLLLLLLRHLKF